MSLETGKFLSTSGLLTIFPSLSQGPILLVYPSLLELSNLLPWEQMKLTSARESLGARIDTWLRIFSTYQGIWGYLYSVFHHSLFEGCFNKVLISWHVSACCNCFDARSLGQNAQADWQAQNWPVRWHEWGINSPVSLTKLLHILLVILSNFRYFTFFHLLYFYLLLFLVLHWVGQIFFC